jgi:hypothetical protein
MSGTVIDPKRSTIDLENAKFREGQNSQDIGVRVFGNFGGTWTPLNTVSWDSYTITYGTSTDVVEYFSGGLTGSLVATFTATYQDFRKRKVISGEWVLA